MLEILMLKKGLRFRHIFIEMFSLKLNMNTESIIDRKGDTEG